jgi:hypothetical protein
MNPILKLASGIDRKRKFLEYLRERAPKFYSELIAGNFLTDKVTHNSIENDFIKALARISGINVFATYNNKVAVENTEGNSVEYDSYEKAFSAIMDMISDKKESKCYKTTISYLDKNGKIEESEGKGIWANSTEDAQVVIDRFFPYMQLTGETEDSLDY